MTLRAVWIGVLLLVASLAGAQLNPVRFTAKVEPATARPNQVVEVVFEAKIDPKWHLYSTAEVPDGPQPTSFAVVNGELEAWGPVKQQDPEKKNDPNFGKVVELYSNSAWFRMPVRVKPSATGEQSAKVSVRFMACDDRRCLPPRTVELDVRFSVSGEALPEPAAPAATAEPSPTEQASTGEAAGSTQVADGDPTSRINRAQQQGIGAFLLLSIGAGLLALLTPCVFPMIPITVSFFAKRRETEGTGSSVAQAGAYCLGIIGTFTALGVIVAAVFGASGLQKLATNPWLNLALAILFIVLALNLFGVFEITFGSKYASKLSPTGKNRFVAPILMAVAFTLTSFTCTLPFVGTLLVAASQGEFFYPIVGMLGFSTAFALPFFLLALFPQALSKLPKSGSWMVVVKAFMGFLEIAAAVKFLSNADLVWQLGILTREVFLALWSAIMAMAGLYMMGWIRLPKVHDGEGIGWIRRGFGLASFACAGWFLVAINGRPLGELDAFMPPVPYPGQEAKAGGVAKDIRWLEDFEEAKRIAKEQNKPIFVDFTGVTCTNCRWMEKNMFPRPGVDRRFDQYVLVKLFTDRPTAEDAANQKLQQELTGSVTLPIYVTMTPDAKVVKILEGAVREEAEFTTFLDSALDRIP